MWYQWKHLSALCEDEIHFIKIFFLILIYILRKQVSIFSTTFLFLLFGFFVFFLERYALSLKEFLSSDIHFFVIEILVSNRCKKIYNSMLLFSTCQAKQSKLFLQKHQYWIFKTLPMQMPLHQLLWLLHSRLGQFYFQQLLILLEYFEILNIK